MTEHVKEFNQYFCFYQSFFFNLYFYFTFATSAVQAGRPFHPTDVFLHRRAKPAKSTDGSVPVFSARPRMATLSLSHRLSFVHYGSISSFFLFFQRSTHPSSFLERAPGQSGALNT